MSPVQARPPVISIGYPPTKRVQMSRGVPYWRYSQRCFMAIAAKPRRRSVFAQSAYRLQQLAGRRRRLLRVRQAGFVYLGRGVFTDPRGEVTYTQLISYQEAW